MLGYRDFIPDVIEALRVNAAPDGARIGEAALPADWMAVLHRPAQWRDAADRLVGMAANDTTTDRARLGRMVT